MPISYAEQLAGAKAKVKDDDLLVLTPDQRKKQEQYNDEWITMKRKFWKDLGELEQAGINSLVVANENYEKAGTASDYFKKLFGTGADGEGRKDIRVRGGTEEYQTDLRDPKTGLPLGAARESLDTQKESKGLLQNIRDILASIATPFSGEAGGSPGAPGGTPGANVFRPGINVPGGGVHTRRAKFRNERGQLFSRGRPSPGRPGKGRYCCRTNHS